MNITKVGKLDQTAKFEMEWEGHKVHFSARSASLTPQFLKDSGDLTSYPKAIAEVLTEWDVTSDDEGTPWPLTEPELAKLPVPFLTAILNTIAESWTGDKKKLQASASG